jgi:hypothetical protein
MKIKLYFGVVFAAALLVGTYNIRDTFKQEPLPLTSQLLSTHQNYIVQNGKVVPLTVLSIRDSNRPCMDCHTYK